MSEHTAKHKESLNNAQDEANSVVAKPTEYINKQALSDDVVPKSEVAELEIKLRQLEDKLRQYEQVCGKLAIKDGVAVGLIDGKETVYILKSISKVTKELAVRRTKVEVAREIFEEIEDVLKIVKIPCVSEDGYITPLRASYWAIDPNDYAELKKKYTEGGGLNEIHALRTPASRY